MSDFMSPTDEVIQERSSVQTDIRAAVNEGCISLRADDLKIVRNSWVHVRVERVASDNHGHRYSRLSKNALKGCTNLTGVSYPHRPKVSCRKKWSRVLHEVVK